MLTSHLKKRSRNEDGVASIEMIPLLMLFAMLFNFTLGFFGIIHTGILNSIAARNYAFETFRQRTNLTYLRDVNSNRGINEEIQSRYTKGYFRFHGIISGAQSSDGVREDWFATMRPIKFTDLSQLQTTGSQTDHMTLVRSVQSRGKVSDIFTGVAADEGKSGVDPVWVQTLYGICLNAECRRK